MKFTRNDYEEMRETRNKRIATVVFVGIIVIGVYFLFIKESPKAERKGRLFPKRPRPANSRTHYPDASKPVHLQPSQVTPKDLPTLFAQVSQSVVLIKTFDSRGNQVGLGSGFFISSQGHLVSNRHVFSGAHRAEVQNKNGTFPIDNVVAEHSKYDLVRVQVKIGNRTVKALKVKNKIPKIGEKVLVIGNPMGLESTISDGIVSAVRTLKPYGKVIQITSPISPGSSGSPVLNMAGEVIGVATFQMQKGQNLNFAIPISRLGDLSKIDNRDLASINFENDELIQSMTDPFDKGMVLFNVEKYEGAIDFFKQAVSKNPSHAEAYLHLGICYRETGATNAIDAFKSAISIDPKYGKAYLHLGIAYNKLNMVTEAIESFREALDIDSGDNEALLNLGISYGMSKKYQAAVSTLEKSMDISPTKEGYYYLGLSYSGLEKHGKAIRVLTYCLDLDPDFMEAYVVLGASYIAVENWRRGIKVMNRAVIKMPESSEIHFILGLLHLGNRDLSSAEREKKILGKSKIKGARSFRNKLSSAISRYSRRRR
ncbi:MAG: tetratricopeptide repeat protein [bacterium]|nr:tetratricopeptide repeat protein [bacterium]